MKKISSIKQKFQSFLDWLLFIIQLCFDVLPEVQPKPTVIYESAYDRKVKKLTASVRAFNQQKRGDAK